jgi:PIN domain nuclease of toxin-antitoxin system
MKILLDTHILIWYIFDDPRLSQTLNTAIVNPENELWLSPISIWEILLLAEKGRLSLHPNPLTWLDNGIQELGITEAPLNNAIAILSRQLACPHQDPADRFIAATAIYYNLYLATVDKNLINTPSLQIIK